MNLYELAKIILILNDQPIDRIRFAKTIYFVHKELIRKSKMKPEDIAYLRLPLGPVPAGFMSLTVDHSDIKIRPIPASILYAAEEYYTNQTTEVPPEIADPTKKILQLLRSHSTPELVISSQDQSWQNHHNGEEYLISSADLRNTFPVPHIRLRIRIKKQPDHLGALQAHLLRGMLNDIVKESTDLEYPDEKPARKKGTDQTEST